MTIMLRVSQCTKEASQAHDVPLDTTRAPCSQTFWIIFGPLPHATIPCQATHKNTGKGRSWLFHHHEEAFRQWQFHRNVLVEGQSSELGVSLWNLVKFPVLEGENYRKFTKFRDLPQIHATVQTSSSASIAPSLGSIFLANTVVGRLVGNPCRQASALRQTVTNSYQPTAPEPSTSYSSAENSSAWIVYTDPLMPIAGVWNMKTREFEISNLKY